MARNFNELRAEMHEQRARENYFLQTGRQFSKLSPTEQRKLIEVEIERKQKGTLSPDISDIGRHRVFDIT